ncbi:hypothetical protein [Moorena producens]|uniref:hypothetical protein n=1 Tax=Moorena producens TaxID=1155739 RepID=UPI003C7298A0
MHPVGDEFSLSNSVNIKSKGLKKTGQKTLLSYPGLWPRGARSVRGKVTPRSITVAHGCAWESPSLRRVGRNYRYIISYLFDNVPDSRFPIPDSLTPPGRG